MTVESYLARTKDGFLLPMERICRPDVVHRRSRHPVLLMHGLFQSSGIFVCNEEHSLAFYLASRGYDVWLGNVRGFCEHESLDCGSEEYWDWCLDDVVQVFCPLLLLVHSIW